MSFKTRDYHEVEATLWSALPERLRRSGRRSAWADANRVGEPADSFLEGPCFDAQDHLVLVDIPFDCILRVSPAGEWQVVAEYEGWPNGLKLLPDGDDLVTDYRRGLLRIAAGTGKLSEQLATRYSESFRGLNDLHLARNGDVYFTDQGQTGLHDPTGRVYRLTPEGALHTLLANAPSPNGLALAPDGKALFIAVTRDAAVWRGALMNDGNLSKVGRFVSFFGATGPDGIAFDSLGRLWVAHPSADSVWVVGRSGEIAARVRLPEGAFCTNLAFSRDDALAYITASGVGAVFATPAAGALT